MCDRVWLTKIELEPSGDEYFYVTRLRPTREELEWMMLEFSGFTSMDELRDEYGDESYHTEVSSDGAEIDGVAYATVMVRYVR